MVEYKLNAAFSALGDPTRRAILRRLRRAPLTVTEIAAPFDVSLNAISKHVKVLERARLVSRKRVGREHVLTLNAPAMQAPARWLADYQQFWETSLDRMADVLIRDKRNR
jgi:DNA-binding transcriptional ArsR family regulator